MGRREYELRDAMSDAWAAARVTGGRFARLAPVYGDRMGLAYQVMLGQRARRRSRRAIAVTALVATLGGALAALAAERYFGHRFEESAAEESPAPAPQDAAFTP
ncbi:hypothetical protein BJ973_002209 [Actinoplanes tereljensis]|uniref:Uncharacterized protein n=1 Tax=Paractinoplanes tereljensis TaxID=571912 RepID=A0A919NQQ7_9ACTN|nr:hypothetical protein [Actinoplanes tereljensis]GIF21882.1 hypothetical protein Ate02nite_46120 [Actinoplanes tereljensis]